MKRLYFYGAGFSFCCFSVISTLASLSGLVGLAIIALGWAVCAAGFAIADAFKDRDKDITVLPKGDAPEDRGSGVLFLRERDK